MSESIMEEILSRLEQLELEASRSRHEVYFSSCFRELAIRPLTITGIAISEGTWKGVTYTEDELKIVAPTLAGIPVLVEHGMDVEGKVVGKVIYSVWDDLLKAIKFRAQITDPEAAELTKAGKIKSVSIKAVLDKVPEGEQIVARNIEFIELSLVRQPACANCHIFHIEELTKRLISQEARSLSEMSEEKREISREEEEEARRPYYPAPYYPAPYYPVPYYPPYWPPLYPPPKKKYPYPPYPYPAYPYPGLEELEKRIAELEERVKALEAALEEKTAESSEGAEEESTPEETAIEASEGVEVSEAPSPEESEDELSESESALSITYDVHPLEELNQEDQSGEESAEGEAVEEEVKAEEETEGTTESEASEGEEAPQEAPQEEGPQEEASEESEIKIEEFSPGELLIAAFRRE